MACGTTCSGGDHEVPFHTTTDPAESAATQKLGVAHEIESSPPRGSTASSVDQELPWPIMLAPVPETRTHSEVVGQEIALAPEPPFSPPEYGEAVHGMALWFQFDPFQVNSEAPTTAVQSEVVGQDAPTLPTPEVEADPVPPLIMNDVVCQAPCWSTAASPVPSTNAQNPGEGQDSAAGLGPTGPEAPETIEAGALQSVPFPVLACSEPSAITQDGPEVHEIAGRIGALTGPVGGAG